MRVTLPVTPATLPRVRILAAAAACPTGTKPPTFELPEADAAVHAARVEALGFDAPRLPPGRWLVASAGPIVQDRTPGGIGPVYSVTLDVLAYVAPHRIGWAPRCASAT